MATGDIRPKDLTRVTSLETGDAFLIDGDTTRSIAQESMVDALAIPALIIKREGYINVEDHGAIGDGLDSSASTNAQAFSDAISALGSNGGTIKIPYGQFKTDDAFANLLNRRGITFEGAASCFGQLETVAPTAIIDIRTSGSLIRLDGTQAICFRQLGLFYSSASYTAANKLINLRSVSGTSDTSFTVFEDCAISGYNSSAKNAVLIDAGACSDTIISKVYFRNSATAILGAVSGSDFSNGLYAKDGCLFDSTMTTPIIAGGLNWSFRDCIAEPTKGTTGGADIGVVYASPFGIGNLSTDNFSFEDGGDNSGSWINFAQATDYGAAGSVRGLSVTNSLFQCGSATDTSFAVAFGSAGCNGAYIKGNYFNRQVNSGFISGASNVVHADITNNFVATSGGPGVGRVFSTSYPGAFSEYDDNDSIGPQRTTALAAKSGGTGNTFMQFSGPASSIKTYTLPNANDTIATLAAAQTLSNKALVGRTDGGAAASGNVGEVVSSTIASGSAVSLTSGTAKTITSILLQPGTYIISAVGHCFPANTTSLTAWNVSISTTDNTLDATPGHIVGNFMNATVFPSGTAIAQGLPPLTVSISVATRYYLVENATFTVSTCAGFGIITAQRVQA